MSNEFNVIECSLCGIPFGFNFSAEFSNDKNYCYECGHSILLIKSEFGNINWDKIKNTTKEQDLLSKEFQTATMYFLNKLK